MVWNFKPKMRAYRFVGHKVLVIMKLVASVLLFTVWPVQPASKKYPDIVTVIMRLRDPVTPAVAGSIPDFGSFPCVTV